MMQTLDFQAVLSSKRVTSLNEHYKWRHFRHDIAFCGISCLLELIKIYTTGINSQTNLHLSLLYISLSCYLH